MKSMFPRKRHLTYSLLLILESETKNVSSLFSVWYMFCCFLFGFFSLSVALVVSCWTAEDQTSARSRVLSAAECKYNLSFIPPADKLQLLSKKNIRMKPDLLVILPQSHDHCQGRAKEAEPPLRHGGVSCDGSGVCHQVLRVWAHSGQQQICWTGSYKKLLITVSRLNLGFDIIT